MHPLDEALVEARKTLALCDELASPHTPHGPTHAKWKRIEAALVEARERVSLPVIATCRACSRCDVGPGRPWRGNEPRRLADRCKVSVGDGLRGMRVTKADEAPPAWCPLRGAP